MPAYLFQLDQNFFDFIYFLPHPLVLVLIMELFSFAGYFGLIWILIAYFQNKFRPVFVALVLVFLIVELLLKFAIARPRPYPSTFGAFLPWESFSFPSGHAAAAFAAAVVLLKSNIKYQKSKLQFKNKKLNIQYPIFNIFLWILAFLISFSRVYLGRHYPLDIMAGGIIGGGIGYFVNSKLKL